MSPRSSRTYRHQSLEEICAEINESLRILTIGTDPDVTPVEVQAFHLAVSHWHASLMRKMGLIETVKRRGGPDPSGYPHITRSTYRINRRSITVEELIRFREQH